MAHSNAFFEFDMVLGQQSDFQCSVNQQAHYIFL